MANQNPSPGNRFIKGVCPNPLGRPLEDPAFKELRKITKQEVVEIGSLLLGGTIPEVKAILKNPQSTCLQVMIASMIMRCVKKGDARVFEILLNRIIGKPTEAKEEVQEKYRVKIVMLPSKEREVS